MGDEALREHEGEWDGVLRRSIDITVRAIDETERSVDVIASTDTVDSHGDILDQDWRLDRYEKNPVVLWNHNLHRYESGCRPEDTLPIGRGENVKTVGGKLQAKLVFPPAELSPLGDRIFKLFKADFIHAVSVGFKPGSVTEELLPEGRRVYRLKNNELREISVVPMGSNPDAVAKAIEVERNHLRRMAGSEETSTMAMTAEEKASYDKAIGDARDVGAEVTSLKIRVKDLDSENTTLKATKAALEGELTKTSERATKAEGELAESVIKAYVGENGKPGKITPAEVEDQLKLVAKIGLGEVKAMIEKRPDLKFTMPATADGAPIVTTPAPGPTGDTTKSAVDAIHNELLA